MTTTSFQSEVIGPLLRDVSRSFYLTLRVLPSEIRPQISLAYLLARATDTIADTKAVPRAKRLAALQQLQNLSHVRSWARSLSVKHRQPKDNCWSAWKSV